MLTFPGFTEGWPIFPPWLPGHDMLTNPFAIVLLAGGVLLFVPRTAKVAALVLSGALLIHFVFKLNVVARHPQLEVVYESASEVLLLLAGAWTIFSLLPGGPLAARSNVRLGQILFALGLPAIGLSHMVYLDMTAPLIPSWIPFHVPLAYLTGAADIAAALAILTGVLARLAATLEATMVSLFTLIIWVPRIIEASSDHGNWSEFCVSAAISGAAWAVAESLRGRSWGWQRGA
jgi:uncharacterized membrane protein